MDYNTIREGYRVVCVSKPKLTLEQALEELFPPERTCFLTEEQEKRTDGLAAVHAYELSGTIF